MSSSDIGWRNHQAVLRNGNTVVERMKEQEYTKHLSVVYAETLKKLDTLFEAARLCDRQ